MSTKLVFACGREISYSRNHSFLKALNQLAEVEEVVSNKMSLTSKLIDVTWQLVSNPPKNPQVYFIGFFGQPLVFPTRLRWRGPLVLDAFVSAYDTLCFDRRLFRPGSLFGRLTFYLDHLSCRFSDIVIVDTIAQARYFATTFNIPLSKLQVVYVGCDDEQFQPLSFPEPEVPTVLFYSTFLPLHGADVIIQAAHRLSQKAVRFQIIGYGQEYQRIRALAERLGIANVDFLAPVPLARLPEIIAHSTICLGGHFGQSEKASRVIAGKTFQCLAVGKPTIVGDNPANRELFTHDENVWMCRMKDPLALADSIQVLLESPELRVKLGKQGREVIERMAGNAATLRRIREIMEPIIDH